MTRQEMFQLLQIATDALVTLENKAREGDASARRRLLDLHYALGIDASVLRTKASKLMWALVFESPNIHAAVRLLGNTTAPSPTQGICPRTTSIVDIFTE